MSKHADTPAPLDDAHEAIPLLRKELLKLIDLFHEYEQLARDDTNPIDLSARIARIGGRLSSLTTIEASHLLPLVDDKSLRKAARRQIENLQTHVEQLAVDSLDAADTAAEMDALVHVFLGHVQLLDSDVLPAVRQHDLGPLFEALSAEQAQWRQNEAAD